MSKQRTPKPRNLEKEAKEIAKLESLEKRPQSKLYLAYLMVIITIIYITDEIATQIGTQMKTEIANGLFGAFGDQSVGIMDALGYISIAFVILAIFYKPLSDRYGRKLFLFINTLGMGVGMLLIFLANNIPVYLAGSILISFFIPHDVQVVYIMESAPSRHRAKFYSVIKACATLGILLVPLFRRIFMTDVTRWRMVYMVPAILGITVALLSLVLARETDSFIKTRLNYLRMTDEEREEAVQQNTAEASQGGIKDAIRFIWGHKQLKWMLLVSFFFFMGVIITSYYQVIMTYGYAVTYMRDGLFTDMDAALNAAGVGPVTLALFMFPLTSALFQLFPGFLADSLGRKPAALITSIATITCFALFFYGSLRNWSPYVMGLLCGAFVGSFWATGDTCGMILAESAPTNLRASIMAAQGLIVFVSVLPPAVVAIILINVFGNAAIGIICLCLAVPSLAAAILCLFLKIHETKGVDLELVTGTEWD